MVDEEAYKKKGGEAHDTHGALIDKRGWMRVDRGAGMEEKLFLRL